MQSKIKKDGVIYRIISLLLTGVLTFSNVINIGYANNSISSKSTISTLSSYIYSDKIEECMSYVEAELEMFKIQKETSGLIGATNGFAEIAKYATKDELLNMGEGSRVHTLFLKLRDVIFSVGNEEEKSGIVLNFAQKIYNYWCRNIEFDIFPDLYLTKGLVEYNKESSKGLASMQEDLEHIQESYEYSKENKEEAAEEAKEIDDYQQSLKDNLYEEGDKYTNENYSYGYEYKLIGNKCVLVEQRYKNGYFFEQVEKEVEKSEYINCGITDYINADNEVLINNNSSNNISKIDKEYLYEDQNKNSSLYVYYTANKDEDEPYYYSTGIRADENGMITYNQLRDSVQQLTMKIKGFYTETDEKTLFVFEGKPLVLKSSQVNYVKDDVIEILSGFETLGLDISEEKTSIYKSSMEKAIDSNGNFKITFNDTEKTLTGVHVYDDNIMIPVVDSLYILEYDVEIDKDDLNLITVKTRVDEESDKKESEVIGILNLNKKIFVDTEENTYNLTLSTKNNIWYAEINSFLGAFNYEGDYYSDSESVVITEITE
jgi:hypothetical protein